MPTRARRLVASRRQPATRVSRVIAEDIRSIPSALSHLPAACGQHLTGLPDVQALLIRPWWRQKRCKREWVKLMVNKVVGFRAAERRRRRRNAKPRLASTACSSNARLQRRTRQQQMDAHLVTLNNETATAGQRRRFRMSMSRTRLQVQVRQIESTSKSNFGFERNSPQGPSAGKQLFLSIVFRCWAAKELF